MSSKELIVNSEIIEFLQNIIRIPSITGQEKEIQEFIATKL